MSAAKRVPEAVVDEVLETLEYDPAGGRLLVELIGAFEARFGITPSRREFLAFMAEADAIAAEHITAITE